MKSFIFVGIPLMTIGLSGCTSSDPAILPEVTTYQSLSVGHTGIRRVHPGTVFGGYTRRRVVEPENWRKRNAPPTGWRDQNVEPAAQTESGS